MAAVLTTSMTLRIVLSVRGSLEQGGSFALSASVGSSHTSHISDRSRHPTNISTQPHTFTLNELPTKPEGQWGPVDLDQKSSIHLTDHKTYVPEHLREPSDKSIGVKVTIDREMK